jgi:hypothetical protein
MLACVPRKLIAYGICITLSCLGLLTIVPGVWGTPAAQVPAPVVLTDGRDEYPLGRSLEILEDPGGEWANDKVAAPEFDERFVAIREAVPNFGFSASAYWLRFQVRNDTPATSDWLLALHDARVGYVDLYLPAPDGAGYSHRRAGHSLPFAEREIAYRAGGCLCRLKPRRRFTCGFKATGGPSPRR